MNYSLSGLESLASQRGDAAQVINAVAQRQYVSPCPPSKLAPLKASLHSRPCSYWIVLHTTLTTSSHDLRGWTDREVIDRAVGECRAAS